MKRAAILFTYCVAVLLCFVIATLVLTSFTNSQNGITLQAFEVKSYIAAFTDPGARAVVYNTVVFSVTAVFVSVSIGSFLAWLSERTDFPWKAVIYRSAFLGFVIPSFLAAMGWSFFLNPKIGLVNMFLAHTLRTAWRINISTPIGMGWVEGLGLSPLVFSLTAPSLRFLNHHFEEAALMSGASGWNMLRRITLPTVLPAILAALAYVVTIAVSSFDVPAVIGMTNRVFTAGTFMYSLARPANSAPNYGLMSVFGVVLIVIGALTSILYIRAIQQAKKYEVVTGKGFSPRLRVLGVREKFIMKVLFFCYLMVSLGVPIITLVWTSFQPYIRALSIQGLTGLTLQNYFALPWSLLASGIQSTVSLMVVVPVITLFIAMIYSWSVVKIRPRFYGALDTVALIPHAVPPVVFGAIILFISLFVLQPIVPIYGTLAVLAIAYIIVRLSYATRLINNGLLQIHSELEEAIYMSGGTTIHVMTKVQLPLLKDTLMSGGIWISLMTYRDLTLAAILFAPGNVMMSTVIWQMWTGGEQGTAAAAGVIMVFAVLLIFGTLLKFTGIITSDSALGV